MRVATRLLLPLLALLPAASGAMTAQGAPAGFRSIELRNGGIVTVRYGAARQVRVHGSDVDAGTIRADGDRLVIDRCPRHCARGHRLEVEVFTPEIARLAVTDGGTIQVSGDFPAQASVAASVQSGGQIDLRPLAAGQVSAAVAQGGRIFARPGRALDASIADGGLVTYWGEAMVTSAVRRGGAVVRGAAAEFGQPLASFDPTVQAPPPLPPLPPMPLPPGGTH